MEARNANATPVRLDLLNENGEVVHTSEFVKEKIVLGRILSADLRIDDPRVSRIHALIEVRGGTVLITDLASSHGTFVNGERVVEKSIKPGDTIRLGQVELKMERGSGKATSSQPTFEGRPVMDGAETQVDIDRSVIDKMDRRGSGPDRRKSDAFPEEKRLEERRQGDRRLEQRSGSERRQTPADGPIMADGMEIADRRSGSERRTPLEYERRVGERRKGDRRVFDITSLERRIEERRTRRTDDDVLPDQLEKAFENPEHARELEVTCLWGDTILDVANYFEAVTINIGESPRNDYIIPSEGIPEEFPLITIEDDGTAYLAFTPDMQGTIRAREKIYTPAQLKDEKIAKKNGEYFVVGLKQDDFAKLVIGNINFFILYVKPAPRIRRAPMFEQDALLLRTMIGSGLFLGLFLVLGMFTTKPKPVTIEMIPERYAKIIIKKKPQVPEKKKDAGSKAGEGAKKKDEPKEAKKDSTPKAPPKEKSARERKVVDAQKAKSVGLLKAFSNQNLGGITDTSDLSAFGKAVNQRGAGMEGVGGIRGFKGVDGGGGGKTIGIDGPSTKGLGKGYGGGGIGEGLGGPGRLGVKGEHAVSIVSENVQVLSGLPKDVINAVVQRHRAEIRACYDAALQRNPALRGKVVISFTIKPNGIVSYAGVKESTLNDAGLENCVLARVKSWTFPKPEAPVETEVSAYPFYLNPAN